MKILHTADWHVGRRIRGRSREEEHRAVLGEIAGIAQRHEVDLVLVTGDQFDSASPTPEAEALVYRALLDLARTGATLVVVAGNHDNPHRLAAVRPFLDLANVVTGAYVARPAEGGVVDVRTRSGETARVALLPFQSQRGIVKAADLMAAGADEHAMKYAERCRAVLGALCADFGAGTVNLVAAHAGVLGALPGGGERAAHIAGEYLVPVTAFPVTAHYVALGHFHATQQVPGPCPIWYAGSPLQLDFADTAGGKHVLLIEASPGRPAQVTRVPLASGRRLRTLSGTMAELELQRALVGDEFLRVDVEERPRSGLADEVRGMFPNAVDVRVRHEREPRSHEANLESVHGSPAALFGTYLSEQKLGSPELLALFGELLDAELGFQGEAPA